MTTGTITNAIQTRLQAAFAPERLEVRDVSEGHRGHAGFREGGESHFEVAIKAPAFAGLSRLARHRAVHAALGPEIMRRIHALSLDISA